MDIILYTVEEWCAEQPRHYNITKTNLWCEPRIINNSMYNIRDMSPGLRDFLH